MGLLRKREPDRPSENMNAHPDRIWFDAGIFGPSRDRLRTSDVGKQGIRSSVTRLLLSSGPAAVARLVISIVVDAVDGVIRRRASAHVGDEVLEDLPAWIDHDAAAGVSAVLTTAFAHVSPGSPFRRTTEAVLEVRCNWRRRARLFDVHAGTFASQTAAAQRAPGTQCIRKGLDRRAAFAGAVIPLRVVGLRRRARQQFDNG